MKTRAEIFDRWAPANSPWSAWAKPVLFAELPDATAESVAQNSLAFDVPAPGRVALLVNLTGPKSVFTGLGLAARGFRPVPLFNALPGGARSLVNVESIQSALVACADALEACALPEHAPPAFLLDAARGSSRLRVQTGCFDNRSVVFGSDFPSGARLLDAGIERVLLLVEATRQTPADLVPTLVAWRNAGLRIEVRDIESGEPPLECRLPKSAFWYRLRYAWHAMARNSNGEFGRAVAAG